MMRSHNHHNNQNDNKLKVDVKNKTENIFRPPQREKKQRELMATIEKSEKKNS